MVRSRPMRPGMSVRQVPMRFSSKRPQESARLTVLAMLATLKEQLVIWTASSPGVIVNASGTPTAATGRRPLCAQPFSDLILELFGPDVGATRRTAIGVATVPLNLPLVVSAESSLS